MPHWKTEIRERLADLRLEPAREAEIVQELSQHLEDHYAESLARGASPEEAARAALAELSASEALLQELRRVERSITREPVVLGAGRSDMIADLWQDIRYGLRGLREHALLSIVVVTMLTLGIGVSTGVFAYLNARFLRPQLDKDFDSFARVYTAYTIDLMGPGAPSRSDDSGRMTLEDYLAFRDRAKSLRQLAAWATQFSVPFGQDDAELVSCLLVTSNFFALYDREQPLLGRFLQPEDYSTASPVVVLSETLWRNRLGADPQIIGKVVHFRGQPVTVVGVTPTLPAIETNAGAWFPYVLESYLKEGDHLLKPGRAWLNVVGRLNPGVTRQEAAAELGLLAGQQDRLHPGRSTTLTVTDGSMIQNPGWRHKVILGLSLSMGALAVFVLIVCVNGATLLLARAATRRQEIAVRLALGASRMRLARMLLTETFLLASLAGLLSLYFAYYFPRVLTLYLQASQDPIPWSLAPDWRVFGYLTFVTLLAGAMAGLTPAIESLKVNLSEMLKGRQNSLGGVARGSWLQGLLIGTQVALCLLLLVFACVFWRSYQKASAFDPGYETRQILHPRLKLPGKPSWGAWKDPILERLKALPGVQSVAYASTFDLLGVVEIQIPGQALRQVNISWISANFFTTLGIPTVRGRVFQERDAPCGQSGCYVVVSERLAREYWPGEDPLGKTFRKPDLRDHIYEVVGVVRDISTQRPGKPDPPMVYLPWEPGIAPGFPGLLLRFSGDEAALARALEASVREISPKISIRAGTLQAERDKTLIDFARLGRTIALLVTFAISLALVGIYGVVSFAVSQRAKEMGIRIALGAGKKDIYRAALGPAGRPVAIGLLIGLVISLGTTSAAARFFQNRPYSLDTGAPITYAIAAILLAAAALLAMLIPARRATLVDPMAALREE